MYVYTGRFAPSPSGPLHLGSLVAAMASYLDARAHNGRWLLRIEDLDGARNVAGADRLIIAQLQALGMHWHGEPLWQSARLAAYQNAYDRLNAIGRVYGCACTRQEINDALAKRERERAPKNGAPRAKHASRRAALPIRPYPGTCRGGLPTGRAPRSWRFKAPPVVKQFIDRWQGAQSQDVEREIGDFVIKRADGLWAYQLAVVVDDGAQGITDIVRGSDLLSSTGAQQLLADHLGVRYPRVMHVPLVHDPWGRKLSKQNHAPALDCDHPVATLNRAWRQLGFQALHANDVRAFWNLARPQWAERFEIRMAENTGGCRT